MLNEIGRPILPIKIVKVALPKNMNAKSIRILDITERQLPYTYDILPAQEPQKIGFSIENPTIVKDDNFYQSKEYYPTKIAVLNGVTDFAGQSIAIITIYPIQYNPSLKTLKIQTNINFVIEGETGYICGDYLPVGLSELEIEKYQEKVKNMVINPEDIVLTTNQNLQPCSVDPGDYDYIIITQSSWVSAFQPLSNWKTKKGIPANIVTTEWIYSNYSGSTNKEKIRAFIVDANTNWGTTFFSLGGDTDVIPCHYVTYPTVDPESIPTDVYYADYDNDWTLEVNVGRASVINTGTGAGGIGNFIDKILTYEKNPPLTNYAKNVGLFGFDLNSATDGEDCKIDIDSLYIPSDWTVTSVYDSHTGNHEDAVDTAVNNGQNLINHIDHAFYDVMGVGDFNHDWYLDTSEVDAFSNGNKQSIWYSIGCWAEAYDYANCIAEHFVRDANGGGVGFIGNSRYGWFYSGNDDLASLRYDRYFFRSFFNQNHYKLGDLFSDHKMDAYSSMTQDNLNKYIFSELNLLGDPELPIWTNIPVSFVVAHPSEIPIGSSPIEIHVETTSGSNIQDAYVCLWKANETYLTGYTNNNGNITFNTSALTSGIMSVTITKQDYIPYEGNISVSTGNQPPNTPSNPNPVNGSTEVDIDVDLNWNCSDPDGDNLTYDVYFGTISNPPLVTSGQTETSYDPGILIFNTTYFWKIVAFDDHNSSKTGDEWNFETKDEPLNYPPDFSDENPSNGAAYIPITTSSLSVYIFDKEGESFNWTIETSPNIGSSSDSNENNGTKVCIISNLDHNTTYKWYVNATDTGSGETKTEIYTFTTESDSNYPPNMPIINGPTNGDVGISYTFTFTSTDFDGDDVKYYVDWGDGTITDWTSFQSSGTSYSEKHIWDISGYYIIKAKAKDENDAESNWATLEVVMPRNKVVNVILLKFINNNPVVFKLIQAMFQKLRLFLK